MSGGRITLDPPQYRVLKRSDAKGNEFLKVRTYVPISEVFGQTQFQCKTLQVTPNSDLCPKLRIEAALWEGYTLDALRLVYKAVCPMTRTGALKAWFDPEVMSSTDSKYSQDLNLSITQIGLYDANLYCSVVGSCDSNWWKIAKRDKIYSIRQNASVANAATELEVGSRYLFYGAEGCSIPDVGFVAGVLYMEADFTLVYPVPPSALTNLTDMATSMAQDDRPIVADGTASAHPAFGRKGGYGLGASFPDTYDFIQTEAPATGYDQLMFREFKGAGVAGYCHGKVLDASSTGIPCLGEFRTPNAVNEYYLTFMGTDGKVVSNILDPAAGYINDNYLPSLPPRGFQLPSVLNGNPLIFDYQGTVLLTKPGTNLPPTDKSAAGLATSWLAGSGVYYFPTRPLLSVNLVAVVPRVTESVDQGGLYYFGMDGICTEGSYWSQFYVRSTLYPDGTLAAEYTCTGRFGIDQNVIRAAADAVNPYLVSTGQTLQGATWYVMTGVSTPQALISGNDGISAWVYMSPADDAATTTWDDIKSLDFRIFATHRYLSITSDTESQAITRIGAPPRPSSFLFPELGTDDLKSRKLDAGPYLGPTSSSLVGFSDLKSDPYQQALIEARAIYDRTGISGYSRTSAETLSLASAWMSRYRRYVGDLPRAVRDYILEIYEISETQESDVVDADDDQTDSDSLEMVTLRNEAPPKGATFSVRRSSTTKIV